MARVKMHVTSGYIVLLDSPDGYCLFCSRLQVLHMTM